MQIVMSLDVIGILNFDADCDVYLLVFLVFIQVVMFLEILVGGPDGRLAFLNFDPNRHVF